MVSRRSVLAAAGAGTAGALAGCLDALPVVGGESGPPSSVEATTESFLADPSMDAIVDSVGSPHGTETNVEAFDGSIADHADALGVDSDLSTYGLWALQPGEDAVDAIAEIDHTAFAHYKTTWEHAQREDSFPVYGRAAGGVGYFTGAYDRGAYASARGLEGDPSGSAGGYDLYTDAGSRASALAEDQVLHTGVAYADVPGEDVDLPSSEAIQADVLQRGVDRTTDAASAPGWLGALIGDAAPFHGLQCSARTAADVADQAYLTGLHVDGAETTVTMAAGAESAAAFDGEDWRGGNIEPRLLRLAGSMADIGLGNREQVRDLVVDGPTTEVGDRRGVARLRMESSAVVSPYPQ